MKATLALAAACVATDPASDTAADTDSVAAPRPVHLVEYDAQGVACVSNEAGNGFGAAEPLTVTVDFGCVDGCGVQSFDTRCSAWTLAPLLIVSGHGHVAYYDDTTTTCTSTCMPLMAQCSFPEGLTEGPWGLSYSATVTEFDVPVSGTVCAADTSDT